MCVLLAPELVNLVDPADRRADAAPRAAAALRGALALVLSRAYADERGAGGGRQLLPLFDAVNHRAPPSVSHAAGARGVGGARGVPVRAARAAAAGEKLTNAHAGAGKPHWQRLTNYCFVVDPRDELASAEAARFAAVARCRLAVTRRGEVAILTRAGPAISLLPARGRRVAPGVDRDSESSGGERSSRAASHHTSLSGRAAPRARAAAAASASSSSRRHGALEGGRGRPVLVPEADSRSPPAAAAAAATAARRPSPPRQARGAGGARLGEERGRRRRRRRTARALPDGQTYGALHCSSLAVRRRLVVMFRADGQVLVWHGAVQFALKPVVLCLSPVWCFIARRYSILYRF